jgi:NADPH-dependent ferric siderophore reductase
MLAKAAAEGISPLEVMMTAMREAWEAGDKEKAVQVAEKAAPYVHAKLAAVQHSGDAENPLESLQRVEIHVVDSQSERPTRVYTSPTTRPI